MISVDDLGAPNVVADVFKRNLVILFCSPPLPWYQVGLGGLFQRRRPPTNPPSPVPCTAHWPLFFLSSTAMQWVRVCCYTSFLKVSLKNCNSDSTKTNCNAGYSWIKTSERLEPGRLGTRRSCGVRPWKTAATTARPPRTQSATPSSWPKTSSETKTFWTPLNWQRFSFLWTTA